jgi:hypothetical protein
MEYSAAEYNRIKNITFSLLYKDGSATAYKYLVSQKGTLAGAWGGLKAELDFYINYQSRYNLTPSLDYGIKCDFSGMIDNDLCRIDVTTNYDYKSLSTYEPLMNRDGIRYKIALMNKNTGTLEEIFDLRFPSDNLGGKLFDVALFMPMDYNSHGEPKYNYYQRILSISSTTLKVIEERKIVTDWYMPDIHSVKADIWEKYQDYEGNDGIEQKELNDYLAESAKLLSKTTDLNIVACGQTNSEIVNPRTCETEEITRIYWKHPLIQDLLNDVIYEE